MAAAFTFGGALILITLIFSLFGNILVLYLLSKPQRRLLKKPLYVFIYNICVVDIAVVVFSMSFKVVDEFNQDWIFGDVMCQAVEYTQRMLFRVNVLTHLYIAADRFRSIVVAFKPQMTRTHANRIIAVSWIFSILISVPLYFSFDLKEFDSMRVCMLVHLPWQWLEKLHIVIDLVLFFIIPMSALIYLYIRIVFYLMQRKNQHSDSTATSTAVQNTIRASMRGVRVSVIVATAFSICWIPVVIKGFNRLIYTDVNTDRRDALYATAMYCAFINDALVPLLYCGLDSNLRPAATKLLGCYRKIQPDDLSEYDTTVPAGNNNS